MHFIEKTVLSREKSPLSLSNLTLVNSYDAYIHHGTRSHPPTIPCTAAVHYGFLNHAYTFRTIALVALAEQ